MMAGTRLSIDDFLIPEILIAEKEYIVAYKPPRMHSAPQGKKARGLSSAGAVSSKSMAEWCREKFPELADLQGRKAGEGGLLHRLDFETHGLLLFARTSRGMDSLLEQQKKGMIAKEYIALAVKNESLLPGFPYERPVQSPHITSAFRPFGEGRKAVRPVIIDNSQTIIINSSHVEKDMYTTEIINMFKNSSLTDTVDHFIIRIRILRGFRHQIRCHLSWTGYPIINDDLYNGFTYGKGYLGLRACSLAFIDPFSGLERHFLFDEINISGL